MKGNVLMPNGPKNFDWRHATDDVLLWLSTRGYDAALGELARRYGEGHRSLVPSTIERAVETSGHACPQCKANTDPNNIPVHPGCHCSVVTVKVEKGITPAEAARLAEEHEGTIARMVGDIEEIPAALAIVEDTVAVFRSEAFRFGDLIEWLAETSESFNTKTELYAILMAHREQVPINEETDAEAQGNQPGIITELASFFVLARVTSHLLGETKSASFNISKHLNEVHKEKLEELEKQHIAMLLPPQPTPEDAATAFSEMTDELGTPDPSSPDATEAESTTDETEQPAGAAHTAGEGT